MERAKSFALRAALLGGAGLGAILVCAPQRASAADAADAASPTIEEVVVTARRREERLIDVPVAASSLSNQAIERYNSTDLATVANNIPGVVLSRQGGGSNGASFSIRGVGNLGFDYGNEQPVAINVDGVQITRGRIATIGLFDTQRLEVLKGPQALFFGKNSPAGVVSIVGQEPGSEFGGYARASYEFRTRTPLVEGAVDLPVSEDLAVRVAGRWSHMYGGYIYNDARATPNPFDVNPATGTRSFTLPGADWNKGPGTRQAVGRFTAVYRPNDDLDVTLKVLGSREWDKGGFVYSEVVQCASGATAPSDVLGPPIADPFGDCKADRHTSNGASPTDITRGFLHGPDDLKAFSLTYNLVSSLTVNYQLGDWALTSVTGFYYNRHKAYDNYDGTVFAQATDAQREENRQYTQEFRAVSNLDGPLNFTFGAFYQFDNRDWYNTDKVAPLGPLTAAGAPAAVSPGFDLSQYVGSWNSALFTARNLVTVYSLFGQARWTITPTLELTGGARWTEEHKKTDIGSLLNRIPSFSPAGYRYHPQIKNDNISPEATLRWKPSDDLTTYVAYKTGFLSAGIQNPGNVINYHGICLARDPANVVACENRALSYEPQKVKGFEGGVKGYLLDRRLLIDLALYRYKFTNLQVTTFDASTLSFLIQNAGGSRSQGAELALQYQATEALQLRASVAYTDLKYTDYSTGPCYDRQPIQPFVPLDQRQKFACYAIPGTTSGEQYLTGTRYGNAPFQSIVGGTYSRELANGLSLEFTLDWYYYDGAPRRVFYALGGEAHSLFNGSIRLKPKGGLWEAALIGTNLANDIWFPGARSKPYGLFTATSGDLVSVLQPPRQVTLQVTRRF
jgi:iron complex outermembrane receptor protein